MTQRRRIDALAHVAWCVTSLPPGALYRYRPLRGLNCCWSFDPGAYAPGFMLSRAPQAEKSLTFILRSPC
jgi:hypothetical protein